MDLRKISLTLPKNWEELSNAQLIFFYRAVNAYENMEQVCIACLLAWLGFDIIKSTDTETVVYHKEYGAFPLEIEQLAGALKHMDFLKTPPSKPIRPVFMERRKPLPVDFSGVPFETWLYCDNLFNTYLEQRSESALEELCEILWPGPSRFSYIDATKTAAVYWFVTLRSYLSAHFPNFLNNNAEQTNEVSLMSTTLAMRLMASTNAQIRALTKGDITKERAVLDMDTWRALAELDALARDYNEAQKQIKR